MINWRRWNNILHRDLGYLCVGLTVIYAISGIAVNHVHHWNPSVKFERVEETLEPIPEADRQEMVATAVERLGLPGMPQESFRPEPGRLQLFYDGWSVDIDTEVGTALVERPKDRFLLRDMNFLHLNHPKGSWTYVADVYAFLILFLAISGMFVLKGKTGLTGRGKWFILAGVVVPVVYVIVLRYV